MADEKLEPLRRGDFGQAEHRFQRFDATVSGRFTNEQLQDPALWVHVAAKINPGDEIRARADDDSFVALLHVTYAVGNKVRLKLIYRTEMDEVDYTAMHDAQDDYEIKQRGPKKWCIMQKGVAKPIKELIPTQREALIELDELRKAWAA